jgi:hypothetical protein
MQLIITVTADENYLIAYHERGMELMPAHTTTSHTTLAEAVASVGYPTRWSLPANEDDGDTVLVGRTA